MRLHSIFPTFLGEVNHLGIGAPAIFIRLAGCNVRCYVKTLGIFCDTPDSLEMDSGKEVSIKDIEKEVRLLSSKTGIKNICLTGGEPLHQNPIQIYKAFTDFNIITETNGTVSLDPFIKNYSNNNGFIIDYKLKSTGVNKNAFLLFKHLLGPRDYVKFVVYDYEDYLQLKGLVEDSFFDTANLAAGSFWGSPYMDSLRLAELLEKDGLAGRILMNFQVHKLVVAADFSVKDFPKYL
jgi:organic radical activating enzyme